MKFISAVCMKDDKDKLLYSLQKCGLVMLCETESTNTPVPSSDRLRRDERLLADLKPYEKKKKPFQSAPEMSISSLEAPLDRTVSDELERLLEEKSALEEKLSSARLLLSQYTPWRFIKAPVELEQCYTQAVSGFIKKTKLEDFSKYCSENDICFEIISDSASIIYIIAVMMKDRSFESLPSELSFEKLTLPESELSPEENVKILSSEISELIESIENLKIRISEAAAATDKLLLAYEKSKAEFERLSAPLINTDSTVIIEGWVAEKSLDEVEKIIAESVGIYYMTSRDPLEDEEVPTITENSRFASQFEGITEMFDPPSYGGIDPNGIMAPWYWIIFGMMMADVGYGILTALIVTVGKFILKPKGNTLKLMNVLLYSSVPTVIFGILFGSYFGEAWNPIIFSPLDKPLEMMLLTMGVGVLHIFTGLITKAVILIKQKKIWDAVFDEFSWIALISGVLLLFAPGMKTAGIVLIAAGVLTLLLTGGRKKKNVFGKISGGLSSLYQITSYLSDILSYTRIFALSLATGVVGMVMNILAAMVKDTFGGALAFLGIIMAVLVYIVGHMFNLALGLLSAYVHDCRLQYIEFYGKFYDGGGKLFKPFKIQTKYISFKDDGGK